MTHASQTSHRRLFWPSDVEESPRIVLPMVCSWLLPSVYLADLLEQAGRLLTLVDQVSGRASIAGDRQVLLGLKAGSHAPLMTSPSVNLTAPLPNQAFPVDPTIWLWQDVCATKEVGHSTKLARQRNQTIRVWICWIYFKSQNQNLLNIQ